VSSAARPARRGSRAPRAVLSWSSGKDAAYALHRLREAGTFDVVALLTSVVRRTGRVSTHGIRGALLTRQAVSVGLPLARVPLPASPSNVVYEKAMAVALKKFRAQGIRHVVFGDLFLEDIRRYRERQLAELGMEGVFPLWGLDTQHLARAMISSGLRARIVAVNTERLPASWAGRPFDEDLLVQIPPGVDPCGENGEFHTFVTAGPVLRRPIPVRGSSVEVRDGVATVDLRFRG
jgi:uncharacterized protein (TIGR00290 family)